MKAFGYALFFAALFTSTASAAPVVPGLANKHALTEPQVGQLLIGELRCAACHTGAAPVLERSAPDLTDVGARVSPEFMRRFIDSPATAHAGTTMPDLLANEPADEREKTADALTHFLVSQSAKKFERQPVDPKEVAAGKALFHTVGCVACHSPRDDAGKEVVREGVVELGHVGGKYSLAALGDFLFQPARVRPSGRMPDMKLTPAEAKAVAGYLLGATGAKPVAFQLDDKLAALGKQHFQRLNCASCHQLGDIPATKPVAALDGADLAKGCVSKTPGKGPRYALDDGQVKAIRAALGANAEPPSEKTRVALMLTAFNCLGCHTRDKSGGVSEETDPYFTTSEKELGDDGRIPPPLTLVGAKLTKVALKKVLFDGDGVRPYMATRMPQYGEPNLRHLPDLFTKLDAVKPIIGIRTANHGFLGFDYKKDGKKIDFGEDVLGGSFRNHHGRWQADSTRGIVVEKNKGNPSAS